MHNLGNVEVGSVEVFQGRERLVIILSAVRSSLKHVESDARHALGFLTNHKRFNVAITRAKALLVVVGNPLILARDYSSEERGDADATQPWRALLRYAVDRGAYRGVDLPPELLHETDGGDFSRAITDGDGQDPQPGCTSLGAVDVANATTDVAGSLSAEERRATLESWAVQAADVARLQVAR
jgi:hypothetical protein